MLHKSSVRPALLFWRYFLAVLLPILLLGLGAWQTANAQRLEPLPIENAFNFKADLVGDTVVVDYFMPSGIYLYRDKFVVTIASETVKLGAVTIPEGEVVDDPLFGMTTVFFEAVTISAKVSGQGDFNLIVASQGCDEETGVCYPPAINTVALSLALLSDDADAAPQQPASGDNADATPPPIEKDEAGRLAKEIETGNILWTMLIFFALGLGLSLTPCVLPMIPILFGVIGQSGENKNAKVLTCSYVAGVTLVFTLAGVAAASSGQLLAAQLQTPPIIMALTAVFIFLSLAMFGLYDIKPPAIFYRYYDNIGKKGGVLGAFLMGGFSVVIVSPCVSAPLVGVLIYIANTGNQIIGALTLFSLALGMSTLLVILGFWGQSILPKPGVWMNIIKNAFGVLMLLLAVWVASPLISDTLQIILYGFLLIVLGLLFSPFSTDKPSDNILFYLYRAVALVVLLAGAVLIIVGVQKNLPATWTAMGTAGSGAVQLQKNPSLNFQTVNSLAALNKVIDDADQPVMVDFYADWCVSCKEFEYFTFTDSQVATQLKKFKLVKVDVTSVNENSKALLAAFDLFGPPGIFFYDKNGKRLTNIRVIGFEAADEFLQTLQAVRQTIGDDLTIN